MAIEEMIFEGKTREIALENAAAKLGADKDLLTYELICDATGGIFGIGATPAKIKVMVEVPDKEPQQPEQPSEPVRTFEPEKISKKSEKKAESTPELKVKRKLTPVPDGDEDAKKISDFILGLLEKLEIENGNVDISFDEDGNYYANVSGSKMGVMIGRRGETLDAVQYLTNLVATRGKDKKVIIDSENYREKRMDTLVALAERTAAKALKYRRNQSLEPMSSYERRIIHAALNGKEHITTFSVGTEPRRKVVVAYKD